MKTANLWATGMLALHFFTTSTAIAQEACTSMQVYLGIGANLRRDVMDKIAPVLKQQLGVDLVTEEMGSGPMLERITAQGATPRVSIAFWDFPVGVDACARGLCKPIDQARAPNLAKVEDWARFHSAGGQTVLVGTNVIGIGLLYNEAELAKRNIPPPTSWTDLGRRDLRGRVSITSPVSTYGLGSLIMLARLKGGGPTNIDPGFEAVQTLLPGLQGIHTFTSELSNLLQLGEVWVATTGSNVQQDLRAKGLPVRWIAPKEGAATILAGASLIANAPCEAAAYEFLNQYYSDAFQGLRIQSGDASVSKSAWDGVSPEIRKAAPLGPDQFASLVPMDWEAIASRRADWIRRWQREIH